MSDEQHLTQAFGALANDYRREVVIGAAANLVLNALRQAHPSLGDAEEELDDLVERMKAAMRRVHYDESGRRNERRIVLPAGARQ